MDFAKKNKMKKPELYLIPSKNPNAFATGRNEAHAVIGVTEGIIDLLTEKELKGVLAHELAHVKKQRHVNWISCCNYCNNDSIHCKQWHDGQQFLVVEIEMETYFQY